MRIGSLLETTYTYPVFQTEENTTTEKENTSFSSSRDSVSISAEAKAAYEAGLHTAAKTDANQEEADATEDDATKAFSEYLDEAKGKTVSGGGGGSTEDQIEALKKKLEKLQAKLAQAAQDSSATDEAKNSRMQVINAEIEQVVGQIAELTGTAANGSA